jgi:hypothetical protein
MGDFFTGLCLGILGFILFQLSDMFGRYPAEGEIKFPWSYLLMRTASYLLMGVGTVALISGLL